MTLKQCMLCVVICLIGVTNASADAAISNDSTPVANDKASLTAPPAAAQSESSSITAIRKPTIKKPVSLPQNTSLLPQLFQVSLGLLFVLGLIVGLAWLFRRFGQSQYAVKGDLKVIAGVHLSTREKVVLLQVGKQQILLGVAPGRVNTLHVLEQPLELSNAAPIAESAFAKRLSSLLQGKSQ